MNRYEAITTPPALFRSSYIYGAGYAISPVTNSTSTSQAFPLAPSLASTQSTDLPQQYLQTAKQANASTKPHETSEDLYSRMESIFWEAKDSFFEDGMGSEFSQKLIALIEKHGSSAIEAITCLILYEKVNPEVAGEALRWLGRVEHPESYSYRRWLLERSLNLPSDRVRDGAILGLASMDDSHAIPHLKRAIEQEACSELRVDMEQVLEQLECLS